METQNITVNLHLHVNLGQNEEGGSFDSLTISALILYLLGFFGMATMLFSIPTSFLFAGIIAAILYVLPLVMVLLAIYMKSRIDESAYKSYFFDKDSDPLSYHLCRMLTGGGSLLRNIPRNFIAPIAFYLFNIFLALFWICYTSGAVGEDTLIALVIPSAYAMYYYPFIMIRNAYKRHSKPMGIAAAAIIFLSFALFLINYDRFMASDSVIGLAFLFSMLTVCGTLAILISNLLLSKRKKKPARLLIAYGIALVIVLIVALSGL